MEVFFFLILVNFICKKNNLNLYKVYVINVLWKCGNIQINAIYAEMYLLNYIIYFCLFNFIKIIYKNKLAN